MGGEYGSFVCLIHLSTGNEIIYSMRGRKIPLFIRPKNPSLMDDNSCLIFIHCAQMDRIKNKGHHRYDNSMSIPNYEGMMRKTSLCGGCYFLLLLLLLVMFVSWLLYDSGFGACKFLISNISSEFNMRV